MNEKIEMKPVVDLMGATKKVLTNMAEFFEKARDDAKDRMISPEKFWSYLTKELKAECKIQDDQLLLAGMPTQLVMDTLELDEAEPVKPRTLTYKNLYLSMKDKSTKKIPIEQAAAKIAPFTKNFKSAMEALVMGDPEAILKVFQHVYGKDVEQWSVPAEESAVHNRFSALAALALSEMYRVGKFNMPSCMFEMKDGDLLVNEEGVKKLVDGFEKADRAWLVSMFPHVVADYLHNIINETKSVLNELPKEVVDKLFVNINPEYLKNLKESELKELAAKFAEATQPKPEEVTKSGGKAKQGTVGKQDLPVGPTVKGGIANKKYTSKMAEARKVSARSLKNAAYNILDGLDHIIDTENDQSDENILDQIRTIKELLPYNPDLEDYLRTFNEIAAERGLRTERVVAKMAEATEDNVWCLVWSLEERFWILGVYPSEAAAESAKSALEVSSISSDLVGNGYERLRGEPAEEIEDGMLMVVDKEGLLGAVESEE